MSWWQAVVLGLVEGITEFLPVSSTGHLLVAQRLLGIAEGDAANAYAICIQAGAIAAVTVVYRERLVSMARGVIGASPDGRRLLGWVALAFLPAALLGPVLDDWIEAMLFGPWPIVAAWLAGAGVIFAVGRRMQSKDGVGLDGLDARAALLIGAAQCVAMWPGTSRSLAAIVGGLLVGLSVPAAVEFSFLLGLVTLTAATAFKAVKHGDEMVAAYGAAPIALGFATAAVSAFLAVTWMIRWLERNGLEIFAAWRIAAAVVVAGLVWTNLL